MPTRSYDHSISDLKSVFDPLVDVAGRYVRLQRGAREAKGLCPFHAERSPSFYVYRLDRGPEHQRYTCFGCGARGDVIDFLCQIEGRETGQVIGEIRNQTGLSRTPSPEALERVERQRREAAALPPPELLYEFTEEVPPEAPTLWTSDARRTASIFAPKNNPRLPDGKPCRAELPVERIHEYRGWRGELLGYVVRTPATATRKKTTPQVGWARNIRLHDGSTHEGWCFGSFPVPRAVFGAPAVTAAREEGRSARYLIVEGEKNQEDGAAALTSSDDRIVISWVGGAQSWSKTDWALVAEGDCALWPDNDDEGKAAMEGLGAHLAALGCQRISWIRPASSRETGWDISDALRVEGWSPERLRAFISDTIWPWAPPATSASSSVGPVSGDPDPEVQDEKILKKRRLSDPKRQLTADEQESFTETRVSSLMMLEHDAPPQDEVLPGGFLAGTVGSIIGKGGIGKSYAAAQIALSVAIGFDVFGLFGPRGSRLKAGRVLYVNAEDPMEEVWRRFRRMGLYVQREYGAAAWLQFAPLFEKNLIVHCTVGSGLTLAELSTEQRLGKVVEGVLFPALFVDSEGARLVILDTTSKVAPELEESDSVHMTQFLQYLDRIATRARCGVLFIHHMNKASQGNEAAAQQGAASGSHKLTSNARWQLNLYGLSEKDAKARDEDPAEAWTWIAVSRPKANYVPGTPEFWWRRSQEDDGLLFGSAPPKPRREFGEGASPAPESNSPSAVHGISAATKRPTSSTRGTYVPRNAGHA